MTEETETTDTPSEDEPLTFGKGMRVRIVDGAHVDIEGELFWWGRSKWGHGMRGGVTPDGAPKEKLWVDSSEIRAIDEEGAELDPQPAIGTPPPRVEVEIRGIDVPYGLGRAITAVRLARGYPPRKALSAVVRLAQLAEVEKVVGARLPDAIVAYVVSALGSTRDIGAVAGLTLEFQTVAGPAIAEDVVAFERDNGNYLGFRKGAAADSTEYEFFDHEEGWESAFTADLEKRLLDELGDKPIERAVQPFEVVVDYLTENEVEPDEPDETWVTHKKFGRGVVLSSERNSKGNKLTVQFEDGETRKLLDTFVQFD